MNELLTVIVVGTWGTVAYWLLIAFFTDGDE